MGRVDRDNLRGSPHRDRINQENIQIKETSASMFLCWTCQMTVESSKMSREKTGQKLDSKFERSLGCVC